MSRVPGIPFRVGLQRHPAQPGGSIPPTEFHNAANLAEAIQMRTDFLKRPNTKWVEILMRIDEATPASDAAALETLNARNAAHKVRIAARSGNG